MGAQLTGVLLEVRLALVLVIGLAELQEGVEWDLRVDDHLTTARQVDDHVGAEKPVLSHRRPLLFEVAVLGHAGRLDRVAQCHFAPAATGLGGPKCCDQVPGLLLELLVAKMQRRDPLIQGGVGALTLDLHVPQPTLVASQGLAEWVQQLGDRQLALREVALGGRTNLVELGVGQCQELLVVLRQCLRRQLRERSGQAFAFLFGPARRLLVGQAEQLEFGGGDSAGRLGRRRGLRDGLQVGRQLRRACLCID